MHRITRNGRMNCRHSIRQRSDVKFQRRWFHRTSAACGSIRRFSRPAPCFSLKSNPRGSTLARMSTRSGAIAWFGDTGKPAKLRTAAEPKEASADSELPKKQTGRAGKLPRAETVFPGHRHGRLSKAGISHGAEFFGASFFTVMRAPKPVSSFSSRGVSLPASATIASPPETAGSPNGPPRVCRPLQFAPTGPAIRGRLHNGDRAVT